MTIMQGETDPISLLIHLMELDHAAMEGYRIAAERVSDEQYQAQLQAFRQDHERHIEQLQEVVRELGGEPPGQSMKTRVLPGMVTIVDREGDEAVLLAMQHNEQGTGEAYQEALENAPEEAREVIARGVEDEQRHVEWLAIALSDLGSGASYQGTTSPEREGRTPPPAV